MSKLINLFGGPGIGKSGIASGITYKLKKKHISVIIISHNLHHVFSVADRIIVLRHGKNVGEKVIKDTDGDEVVKMITGAEFTNKQLA